MSRYNSLSLESNLIDANEILISLESALDVSRVTRKLVDGKNSDKINKVVYGYMMSLEDSEEKQGFFKKIWEKIKEFFLKIIKFLRNMFVAIGNFFKEVFNWIFMNKVYIIKGLDKIKGAGNYPLSFDDKKYKWYTSNGKKMSFEERNRIYNSISNWAEKLFSGYPFTASLDFKDIKVNAKSKDGNTATYTIVDVLEKFRVMSDNLKSISDNLKNKGMSDINIDYLTNVSGEFKDILFTISDLEMTPYIKAPKEKEMLEKLRKIDLYKEIYGEDYKKTELSPKEFGFDIKCEPVLRKIIEDLSENKKKKFEKYTNDIQESTKELSKKVEEVEKSSETIFSHIDVISRKFNEYKNANENSENAKTIAERNKDLSENISKLKEFINNSVRAVKDGMKIINEIVSMRNSSYQIIKSKIIKLYSLAFYEAMAYIRMAGKKKD